MGSLDPYETGWMTIFYGKTSHLLIMYPLVNVDIAMENHHAINGKIIYWYGHFQ